MPPTDGQTPTGPASTFRCIYHCFPVLHDINWLKELQYVTTALLLTITIYTTIRYLNTKHGTWINEHPGWTSQLERMSALLGGRPPESTSRRRGPTCPPQRSPYDSTRRVVFAGEVRVYAWPSRGGVIIHDHVNSSDFDFLDLDPLAPPPVRCLDQKEEDAFCQRLLLLGANWYDSEARYQFLLQLRDEEESGSSWRPSFCAIEDGRMPPPTRTEKCFSCVGWPTSGGLWVADYTTNLYSAEEGVDFIHEEIARLKLVRTMDEKCQVLRTRFGAKWYESIAQYEGAACLNAWEWKKTGEVGNLEIRKHPRQMFGVEKADI